MEWKCKRYDLVSYTRLGAFRPSQSGKPSSVEVVVLGCAPIGEVYVLGLLKAKRASVPTQAFSTEVI